MKRTKQYSPALQAKALRRGPRKRPAGRASRDGHRRLSPAVRRLAAEYQRRSRLRLRARAATAASRGATSSSSFDDEDQPQQRQSQPRPSAAERLAAAPAARSASGTARPPCARPARCCRSRGSASSRPSTWSDRRPRARMCCKPSRSTSSEWTKVRKSLREAFKARHGHSLTYLPFIANAVCQALHEFPNLNSSVQGDGLVIHENVNLAIAVDLGAEGLVAPVIKFANKLSVSQLASAINDVSSQRARRQAQARRLSLAAPTRCRTRAPSAR